MSIISATHPSNVFKYCPRCGHSDFIFDGIKAFSCPACGFRYYINSSSAVAAIIVLHDKRIVLTKRKFDPRAGTYDLPGGFVDLNERVEHALVREIREELGIEITSMQFLGSFPNEYEYKGISYFTSDLAFVCSLNEIPELKPADDVSEAIFVNPYEIDFSQISFPSIINILKSYTKS
jgi:NAD+ diphosphatase